MSYIKTGKLSFALVKQHFGLGRTVVVEGMVLEK